MHPLFLLLRRLHRKSVRSRLPCAEFTPRVCGAFLGSFAVSRSCFGYSLSHLRTAAACLSRCIRHRRHSKANRASSPCTGEPRNARSRRSAGFAQGRRKMRCKRYTLSGDTTPQSFRLVNKPKIQLPLHRGAEKCTASTRCKPYTGGENAPGRRCAGFSQWSRERTASSRCEPRTGSRGMCAVLKKIRSAPLRRPYFCMLSKIKLFSI